MGLFDFMRGKGRRVQQGNEAAEIRTLLTTALGSKLQNLTVTYKDGLATLTGQAATQADREKAVLLAGNVSDVERVDDRLTVAPPPQAPAQPQQPQTAAPRFYTIESGDSLSKIAKAFYGDANRWPDLFEANREVIEDPDKIYPGQQIRVPQD